MTANPTCRDASNPLAFRGASIDDTAVQGVEVLLQALLGGFACVDGTAQGFLGHGLSLKAKNLGPDHLAPVMTRAMAESER